MVNLMLNTPAPLSVFLRNLMAYGASEVASKLSRLLVVVAVARSLSSWEIGVAAGALALGDLMKSLTQTGVGQRIIAARDPDVEAVCITARRIFMTWAFGLFTLQASVALAVWMIWDNGLMALMLVLLAAEYLFMPFGQVQAFLSMRDGKMRKNATIAGAQVVGANLMSVVLVLIWPSAFALILPRLLAAPLWTIAMRRLRPWSPATGVAAAPIKPFVTYGWAVLGVEVAMAMRMQLDKLAIGAMMGAETLGLYFMAFNAGLGLATSFSVAFSIVVFPHLCTADDRATALRQSMIAGVMIITPIVLLQAALAPVYVPILFGSGWEGISDVVSILCLAAVPATLWSASAGWLRANNRPHVELGVTLLLTSGLLINTVLMAPHGLVALAWGYLAVAMTVMIGASLPAIFHAFGPKVVRI